jgi:AcrR family transcriptional regulator
MFAMTAAEPPTRRERLRRQTLDEIREHALAQIDAGGLGALSLNAVAKSMGMSGPALYRYFPSRDALLATLVTEVYGDLTAALEQAVADASRRTPARRLAAGLHAYRAWALAHPRRYALLFGDQPDDFTDPEEAIATIHGGMLVLLRLLADLVQGTAPARPADALDRQLVAWAARRGPETEAPPLVLRLGVLTWTRLHGIVGLELAGVFAAMELDAGLLLDAEVESIVAAAAAD